MALICHIFRAQKHFLLDSKCRFIDVPNKSLNCNPHFHSLLLDGVFNTKNNIFHSVPSLQDEDVKEIVETTAHRVIRMLERRGVLEQGEYDVFAEEQPVLAGMTSAKKGLERLCNYVARPPLAAGSLQQLSEQEFSFKLKTPWSNGTTHLILSPNELIEKLAALVPPPRQNLVRYHGVLAPHSKLK